MFRTLVLLLLLSANIDHAFAQNACDCDVFIAQSGTYRPASAGNGPFYITIKPGDKVCIAAGNYSMLRFIGFQGSSAEPFTVTNCGGQVTIGHNSYFAPLDFQNCQYFRVTGSGEPGLGYGIRIDSAGTASAMSVGARSSNVEIDHLEIAGSGFAGMMVKTDPTCNPNTWRQNFTMFNVDIHHNYIHDTGAEGFYVGHTFFNGRTITCAGQTTVVYPHNIVGLKIHHNLVERAGAECIQYACAPDALVYNNVSDSCGIDPFENFQNNGVQVGGGAGGDFFGNIVRNAAGAGVTVLGHLGGNRFFNNLIIGTGSDGFFTDDRPGSLPNTTCHYLHNTVVNAGRDAIRCYNQNNIIHIANNALVEPNNQYITFQQGATATQSNNYFCALATNDVFEDFDFYRPAFGSPLLDAGFDGDFGIKHDLDSLPRPYLNVYDIGAFEKWLPAVFDSWQFEKAIPAERLLTWQTSFEHELEKYEIERSFDGLVFEKIGEVSAENAPNGHQYEFRDTEYSDQSLWYRLRLVEFNGRALPTDTLFFENNDFLRKGRDLRPETAQTLELPQNGQNYEVLVYDLMGRLVRQFSWQANDPDIFSSQLNSLGTGIYRIELTNAEARLVRTLALGLGR